MTTPSSLDPHSVAPDAEPAGAGRRTPQWSSPAVVPSAAAPQDDRSTHLRTKFLRRLAHDIASPTGVTTTALQELASSDVNRPELVAMARRGLRRLLRLSEQLAVTADLEAGALTPDTTLEDARVIAKAALEQAIAIDGRRDISTSLESSRAERLPIEVDRRLVESVLREVIGNALRLASSRVLVEVSHEGERAILRVHDDGPGFSQNSLSALGERFSAHATERGLGLSLSIAKDVLAAHGGELQIATSTLPPGRRGVRGAQVVISLPLSPLARPSRSTP
jgi:signal transduction histidine kinase